MNEIAADIEEIDKPKSESEESTQPEEAASTITGISRRGGKQRSLSRSVADAELSLSSCFLRRQ